MVAHTGHVVLDMATAINSWYNAKVGTSTPTIGSGAFVTLMTEHLDLARKVDGGLEWVEDKKTAITLTFVRNNSSDKWDFVKKFGAKHASMDFEKVEAFFTEHVKVKVLDSSNLMPLEKREVEVMQRTSNLVGEYEKLTGQILK